ncbi:hypothetical protein PUV47_07460 [Pseudovibrio exalbescens]|uniref:hypothetical protein n=1 Tax=Pseudovibrio exalbescens TaxID=197461 RepID=UPI002365546A|nr:hypothetical protein [Pseudovibrio exalbescens]MDD7909752.1 hypothetical protein [Pseudovibrio exalbescens]
MSDGYDKYVDDQIRKAVHSGTNSHADPAVRAQAAMKGIYLEDTASGQRTPVHQTPTIIGGTSDAIDNMWDMMPWWVYAVFAAIGAVVAVTVFAPNAQPDGQLLVAAAGAGIGAFSLLVLRALSHMLLWAAILGGLALVAFAVLGGG